MTDTKRYRIKIYDDRQRYKHLQHSEKCDEGTRRKNRHLLFLIFRMCYCKHFWLPTTFKNSSTNFLILTTEAFLRIRFYIISCQQLISCLPDLLAHLRLSRQEVISYLHVTFTLSSTKMTYKLCPCSYLKKSKNPFPNFYCKAT